MLDLNYSQLDEQFFQHDGPPIIAAERCAPDRHSFTRSAAKMSRGFSAFFYPALVLIRP